MPEPKSQDATIPEHSPRLRADRGVERGALPPLPKAKPAGTPSRRTAGMPPHLVPRQEAAPARPHVAAGSAPIQSAPVRRERAASPTNVIPLRPSQQMRAVQAPADALPLPAPPPAPAPRAPTHQPQLPVFATPAVAYPTHPTFPTFTTPGPVMPASAYRWEVFEQLGLGNKEAPKQNTQKMLVNTYRGLGFAVLTIIVVVLIGYIATTAFYYLSTSWVQPMVVSQTDERVLSLEAQLAQQENERDRIAAELGYVDSYIAVQQTYQAEFAQAIRADLEGRKQALGKVRGLAASYAGARARVSRSNAAYAKASAQRMAEEYRAGLIDRSDMLSGKYQLAQITTSNLSLAERQAEFESRAVELAAEAKALDAIVSEKGGDGALSYDVLKIKQEYEMSRLETQKAIANREALKASAARQKAILDGLHASPYLRAIHDGASVAFVPYANMGGVEKGADVYGCSMEMVWCHHVGTIREVLPGEVQFKHPHRDKLLRGRMIELSLDDDEQDAAQKDVLFVGGRPLHF